LPVVGQMAEVVIDGTVFLSNDDDVFNGGDVVRHLSKSRGHSYALPFGNGNLTIDAAARAAKSGEVVSGGGGGGQTNAGAVVETGGASRRAVNSSRAAGDGSRSQNRNRQLRGSRRGKRRRDRLIAGNYNLA